MKPHISAILTIIFSSIERRQSTCLTRLARMKIGRDVLYTGAHIAWLNSKWYVRAAEDVTQLRGVRLCDVY